MTTLHGTLRPWSEEELGRIHTASLRLLETTGVYIAADEVLDALEATDARVDRDSGTVRFPSDTVQHRLDNAPGCWDRAPLQPGTFSVSADCGSPAVWDYGLGGARPVRPADLVDVPRLVQALPHIDGAGCLVVSDEIPDKLIDAICCRNRMIHCTKRGGGGLGRFPSLAFGQTIDGFDLLYDVLAAAEGTKRLGPDNDLSFFMGASSPLRWGRHELLIARHVIQRGQVVGIGGNCISGIQSPITPAANIMIDHSERLSGMCIVTAIDPEARFYFCNHTYALDMRSGDVASGSPEQTLLALLGKRLLEHLGLNLVTSHPVLDVGSHIPDAQAGAEKMMYMLLTALGGARSIGGAGQLKEILSCEQLVIDNEIAGYVKHLLRGAEINDDTLALDVVAETGIGGSFLDSEPTLRFLRECYHDPQVFYRKRMSEWQREGAGDVARRAHEKVEAVLSSETPVFLDEDRIAAMDEVIEEARQRFAPEWDASAFLPRPGEPTAK